MPKTIKTAISLPAETFRRAEAARKKEKRSRSELYAKALEAYLRAEELRAADARYEESYRKHPLTAEEIADAKAWDKIGATMLAKDPW